MDASMVRARFRCTHKSIDVDIDERSTSGMLTLILSARSRCTHKSPADALALTLTLSNQINLTAKHPHYKTNYP